MYPREAAGIFVRGVLMGASDIIPGVSGGTIAFITGIYERLVTAISNIRLTAAWNLLKGDKEAFFEDLRRVDPVFLLVLVTGIGLAAIVMSQAILFLLESWGNLTYAFFFGLILASAVLIVLEIETHDLRAFVFVVAGLLLGYWIAGMHPASLGHSLPVIFVTGMVAVCAMILPGISGAYITLLFNQYEYLLQALRSVSMPEIVTFIAGGAIGLVIFSRALKYLLVRHHTAVLALLTGIMIGSTRLLIEKIGTLGGFHIGSVVSCATGLVLVGAMETVKRRMKG